MMPRYEIGQRNGKKYRIERARMCDIGKWESKARRWFLSIEDDYAGDFATKKEAYNYIDNL